MLSCSWAAAIVGGLKGTKAVEQASAYVEKELLGSLIRSVWIMQYWIVGSVSASIIHASRPSTASSHSSCRSSWGQKQKWFAFSDGSLQLWHLLSSQKPHHVVFFPTGQKPLTCFDIHKLKSSGDEEVESSIASQSMVSKADGARFSLFSQWFRIRW